MLRFLALLLSLIVAGLPGGAVHAQSNDPVIRVPGSDKKMNAAIARARDTLPIFWTRMRSPKPNQQNFSLKVMITDGAEVEHFWLGDIVRGDGNLTGTINNQPQLVKSVKLGQRYKFGTDDISDWMYIQDAKIYGGYTIRVLVEMMPKAKAARIKALLAYRPK